MKRIGALILVLMLLLSSTAIAEWDFSNMTEDELQELINQASEQLNALRTLNSESTEKLVFSGDKTKIISGVTIDFSPCRVTFIQDSPTEFSVSYLLNERSRSLMHEYSVTSSYDLIKENGVYEFSIEASSPWTFEIEPLSTAGKIELSGQGDWVSDIYTIYGSTIISINAKYNDFDNCIIDVYTLGKYGWSSNNLTNGLKSSGTETYDKIIKASGETQLFFTIDFDHGEWSISTSDE